MLSRVAERMYWFGRYLERAESIARLLNVNSNLMLDLPIAVNKYIWASLIEISGSTELFFERHDKTDEKMVIGFILADSTNPGSLLSTVKMIRENMRTTREIMPSEAWEQVNEFYLYVKKHLKKNISRSSKNKILDDVMDFCHQTTGFLQGNMSHGQAYNFIRIGRNLERADMTTRILDVGCMNLYTQKKDIPETYDNIMWMNVLRSLSAYQMYRQHVLDKVNGKDVTDFLIGDEEFPRAVAHCLAELNHCVNRLSNNDMVLRSITRVQRMINEMDTAKIFNNDLHEFIDQLQIDLADTHEQVSQTWFRYTTEEIKQ